MIQIPCLHIGVQQLQIIQNVHYYDNNMMIMYKDITEIFRFDTLNPRIPESYSNCISTQIYVY